MHITSTTTLNNGVTMPWLGLGVFQSEPGPESENAVRWALEIGYRHIDTASFYHNEESVGKAIRESKVNRDELFVTTKVWNTEQGYDQALSAFDASRKRLDMDVVDLYLVHWPIKEQYKDTWKALEKLYSDGKVRAIGVSNFLVHHLSELSAASDLTPAVNQVEFHPFVLQQPLLDYCAENHIQFEAWSPLTRARFLDNEAIVDIARSHGKSPAQVLIRWDLQKGVVSIPKSVHRERIEENSHVFDFELTDAEMERLDSLDSNTRIGPHPDEIGGWR
jgi:diketogulonate reductase-like aldo/keto reductase